MLPYSLQVNEVDYVYIVDPGLHILDQGVRRLELVSSSHAQIMIPKFGYS